MIITPRKMYKIPLTTLLPDDIIEVSVQNTEKDVTFSIKEVIGREILVDTIVTFDLENGIGAAIIKE